MLLSKEVKCYNELIQILLSSNHKFMQFDNSLYLSSMQVMIEVASDLLSENHNLIIDKELLNDHNSTLMSKSDTFRFLINDGINLDAISKLSKLEKLNIFLASSGFYIDTTDKSVKQSLKLVNKFQFSNAVIDSNNNLMIPLVIEDGKNITPIWIYFKILSFKTRWAK